MERTWQLIDRGKQEGGNREVDIILTCDVVLFSLIDQKGIQKTIA